MRAPRTGDAQLTVEPVTRCLYLGVVTGDGTQRRFILGLLALGYLYVSPYFPGVNNPNENVRFYMTVALVEEGRYAINTPRREWGWVNDAAKVDGQLYSVKAPGASLMAVPGYAAYLGVLNLFDLPFDRTLALRICRLTAVVFPALLFLGLYRRFLIGEVEHAALADSVLLSVGLGSLLYPYGMLLVSHTLAAAAVFGAFACLRCLQRDAPDNPRALCFAAGLLSAGVTFFEYPGLICSVALSALAVWVLRARPRLLLPFAAGGLLPTLAMMHFQWSCFGSPWTPGHKFVETVWLRMQHHQGVYGADRIEAEALYGLLIDPGRGLLPMTPILLLAPLGLLRRLRTPGARAEAMAASLAVVGTVLAMGAMINWRGGWSVGPRYLAPIVPLLGWAAVHELQAWHRRRPAATLVFAVGATLAALASSGGIGAYYPHPPPNIELPLRDLLPLLIAHDFAPSNAAGLLGLYGSASMLPLLLCALAVPVLLLRGHRHAVPLGLAALALAGVLLSPALQEPRRPEAITRARAYVTGHWHPAGHDRASRLYAQFKRAKGARRASIAKKLRHIYRIEGRERDARALAELER